jgi:hypothetical protein
MQARAHLSFEPSAADFSHELCVALELCVTLECCRRRRVGIKRSRAAYFLG